MPWFGYTARIRDKKCTQNGDAETTSETIFLKPKTGLSCIYGSHVVTGSDSRSAVICGAAPLGYGITCSDNYQ